MTTDPEIDAWVHAVNQEAARMDQQFKANADRMASTVASSEVVSMAMGKLMKPTNEEFKKLARQDGKAAVERLGAILPQRPAGIVRGATVYASEDIHANGEVIVKTGTRGKIESQGKNACNVRFNGYQYIVLCLWDMITTTCPQVQPPLF